MTFLSLRGTLRDERSASSSDVPSFFFFPWPFPIVRFLFPSFEGLFDESFHGEKKRSGYVRDPKKNTLLGR